MRSSVERYRLWWGDPAMLAVMLDDLDYVTDKFTEAQQYVCTNNAVTALDVALANQQDEMVAILSNCMTVGELSNERLILSAESGDVETVKQLLGFANINVNSTYKTYDDTGPVGMTALYAASALGHVDCVGELLGVSGINLEIRLSDGGTALMIAAYNGHHGIVQQLIKAGADVNAELQFGHSVLTNAIANGHENCVEVLLEARAINLEQRGNYRRDTPLNFAARKGHAGIVKRLLAAGADVNALSHCRHGHSTSSGDWSYDDGKNALFHAVENGHIACAELLLKASEGDFNEVRSVWNEKTENFGQRTPLMVALEANNQAMADLLLKHLDYKHAGVLSHNEHSYLMNLNKRGVALLLNCALHGAVPEGLVDAFISEVKKRAKISGSYETHLIKSFFIKYKAEIIAAMKELPPAKRCEAVNIAYEEKYQKSTLYQIFHTGKKYHRTPSIVRGNLKKLHELHESLKLSHKYRIFQSADKQDVQPSQHAVPSHSGGGAGAGAGAMASDLTTPLLR